MTDWQPIETAPKDGTRIIVATTGRYWYEKHKDGWMIANCDEEYGMYVEATHWMPLPEPPK